MPVRKKNKLPEPGGKENSPDYIVGVGASAGGLEAIHDLFDNMPDDTNFSFVVIQHLSPDYKSLMGELLSKHTAMQVFEAQDEMPVQKNCIYLIPSKKIMTIQGLRSFEEYINRYKKERMLTSKSMQEISIRCSRVASRAVYPEENVKHLSPKFFRLIL